MAVEVAQSDNRQIVQITWDKSVLDGEVVQLFCANPENGDISQSGLSANDGKGSVSYPEGYVGTTEITVFDNHGNSDFGVIEVGEGDVTQPEPPTEPTVPVDPGYGVPEKPVDPEYGVDEGTGPVHPDNTLPEPEQPVDPGWGIDVDSGLIDLLPTHPIVYPPEINPLH